MVPRRVYFGIFGSGLGHVTRVVEMAGRLPAPEFEVMFSSSGQGIGHLESKGKVGKAVRAPHLDVEWSPGGGFSSHRVLPRFPITLNTFLKQVAFERNAVRKFDPAVVVSDSRLSPVFAAKSTGYPVIVMLNQFKVLFPERFRGRVGRFYERVAGDALGLMWSLGDRVLMTDLPPPYTIAEANLSGLDVASRVEFVGFTAPQVRVTDGSLLRVKSSLGLGARPLVFCPISGPDPTKGRFAAILLRVAGSVRRRYDIVISMGYSKGSQEPKKIGDGAWLFDWCPVRDELFELSSVVVARAGHSTIGQCIDHSKPAVLVPIHNHPEQVANADKFSRLGLGVSIRAEDLTSDGLLAALDSILADPGYLSRMGAVTRVSKKYDGMENTLEIIKSYAR